MKKRWTCLFGCLLPLLLLLGCAPEEAAYVQLADPTPSPADSAVSESASEAPGASEAEASHSSDPAKQDILSTTEPEP